MTSLGNQNSQDDWLAEPEIRETSDDILLVDVDGFEGSLDLLLDMARRQKVDLANISVLALAEQYLGFIEKVRKKRIEIAADYLVMAAWLAYLKSRLMVPQAPSDEEPSGEMMAAMLQFRLKRLEAMRNASQQLQSRSKLGVDRFARGMPEPVIVQKQNEWRVSVFDLLKAYGGIRERAMPDDYLPTKRKVWALREAREILERLLGETHEWSALDSFLIQYIGQPSDRATVIASSFSATLEMVREGQLEMRQALTFGPIMLRRRDDENGQ